MFVIAAFIVFPTIGFAVGTILGWIWDTYL